MSQRRSRELRGRWDSEILAAWAAAPGFEVNIAVRDDAATPPVFYSGPVIAWALVRGLGRELVESTEVEPVFFWREVGHPTHASAFRRSWDGCDVRLSIVQADALAVLT